jgi:UDP-3-O-[3-hydroxymyristoyl] N-acetylglucosamine deacetylase
MYMLGKPLLASYTAFRSGHELNNRLARALMAQPQCWEIATFEDEAMAPPGFAQLAPAW